MKINHNNKIRRILCTACGTLCVGTLLCTAILFPKQYCIFLDKNTLNQIAFTDININPYETAYASFAEKLHALARANTIKSSLRAVPVNELEFQMSRKELTKIANKELKKLYGLGILPEHKTLNKKILTVCERYTIYETNNKNGLKGISLWELVFENKKRIVTIYLDEEYHKIYSLAICFKNATFTGSHFYQLASSSTDSTSPADELYKLWDDILQYYDLLSYSQITKQYIEKNGTYGIIEFEKKYHETPYQMVIYRNTFYNQYGNQFWKLGIPLEEMIQF